MLLVLIILILLFGGGGIVGPAPYRPYGFSLAGLILLVLLIWLLFGAGWGWAPLY